MRSDIGYAAVLFPCVWIVIGNYILLNLFLALVLEMFANGEEENSFNSSMNSLGITRRESFFGSLGSRSKRKKEERLKLLDKLEDSESEEESKTLEDLKRESAKRKEKVLYIGIECEKSFFVFIKTNPIRLLCHKISSSQLFDNMILSIIAISTGKLI